MDFGNNSFWDDGEGILTGVDVFRLVHKDGGYQPSGMQQSDEVPMQQMPFVQQGMLVPLMPVPSVLASQQQNEEYDRVCREYSAALLEISNLKAGIPENDFGLLEDVSAKRMYIAKGAGRELFAEMVLGPVQMLRLINLEGKNFRGYAISFVGSDGREGGLLINEKILDSPKLLLQEFEKAGVAITLKRSAGIKHTLLRRLIIRKAEENIAVFPYLSGWSGGRYYYISADGAVKLHTLGFNAPLLQKHFSELQMQIADIQQVISQIVECFGENVGMLLLSIATGAILYTPLSEAGFSLDSLLVLDCRKKSAKEARKCLQIWDTEIRIPLSKGKNLAQSVCDSMDEVIFLMDEETDYSLKMGRNFIAMLLDGEVQSHEDNSIRKLQAMPLLLTKRVAAWTEFFDNILSLPLSDDIPMQGIDVSHLSAFYRTFCDWLNANVTWLPEKIAVLETGELQSLNYGGTYRWIMASYQILTAYLQALGIVSPVNLCYFNEFLQDWLNQAEVMGELNPGEIFIETLLTFKTQNILCFEDISQYGSVQDDKLFAFYDSRFVYISAEIFKRIINNFLSGYSYSEVYQELVKMDYAKGERGHVFPKVTLNVGNNSQRFRMAKLHRNLLLSDEEMLLGV